MKTLNSKKETGENYREPAIQRWISVTEHLPSLRRQAQHSSLRNSGVGVLSSWAGLWARHTELNEALRDEEPADLIFQQGGCGLEFASAARAISLGQAVPYTSAASSGSWQLDTPDSNSKNHRRQLNLSLQSHSLLSLKPFTKDIMRATVTVLSS